MLNQDDNKRLIRNFPEQETLRKYYSEMKFVNSFGTEAVEIRLPNGKVIHAYAAGSCRGIIGSICSGSSKYDASTSYLVNEKGIVYENCKLSECEGDLSLVCTKLKSKFALLGYLFYASLTSVKTSLERATHRRGGAKLRGKSGWWSFLSSETARNTDYNSQRVGAFTSLWFVAKPPCTHHIKLNRTIKKGSRSVRFNDSPDCYTFHLADPPQRLPVGVCSAEQPLVT